MHYWRKIIPLVLVLVLTKTDILALNTVWQGTVSNNMNDNSNWNANFPGSTDTGAFSVIATSKTPSMSNSTKIVGAFNFLDNTPFNFSFVKNSLTFAGNGIVNPGTGLQTFNLTNASSILFENSSTAGRATYNVEKNSILHFTGSSTAGDAKINVTSHSSLIFDHQNNTLHNLFVDSTSTVALDGPSILTIGNSNDLIIAGKITEAGSSNSLVKKGTGSLTLSGKGLYTGPTTVQKGNFILTGSLAGDALVSGGTLSGNGTVGGNLQINAGGTVVAGDNAIGTLHVSGNYTQLNGSTYRTLINEIGESSLIKVDGTASLGGVVFAETAGGFVPNSPYKVIHAHDGVSGVFTSIQAFNSTPLVIPSVIYDAKDVYLSFALNFSGVATTPNQLNVAQQLDTVNNGDVSPDALRVINAMVVSDADELPSDLDQLTGEQYTNLIPECLASDRYFNRRVFNAVRDRLDPCNCLCECKAAVQWGVGEYGERFLRTDSNAHGFNSRVYDASIGISYITPCVFAGLAGNYERDHINFKLNGRTTLHTGQGAFYFGFKNPCFYAFSDLIIGYSSAKDFRRTIDFADLGLRARSSPKIYHGLYYLELGKNISTCNVLLQPYVAGNVESFKRKGFMERNADPLNLRVFNKSGTTYNGYVGLHTSTDITPCIALNCDVAWQCRFGRLGERITVQLGDFGVPFTVVGVKQARNSICGGANLLISICKNVEITADILGERWDRFSSYEASLGLKIWW